MTQDNIAVEDQENPSFRGRWSNFEKFVGLAAVTVGVWLGVGAWQNHQQEANLRQELLDQHQIALDSTSEKVNKFIDNTNGWISELGARQYSGDLVPTEKDAKKHLANLLAKPGVYVRMAQQDSIDPDHIRSASRHSKRDALALCVGEGMADSSSLESSQWIGQIENLTPLHDALYPHSNYWRQTIMNAHSGLELGVLKGSLLSRDPGRVGNAKETVENAAYFLVAIDELPSGWQARFDQDNNQAVKGTKHSVRLAIVDLETNQTVVRMKREVDAQSPTAQGAEAVLRQVEGCELGLAAREFALAPTE